MWKIGVISAPFFESNTNNQSSAAGTANINSSGAIPNKFFCRDEEQFESGAHVKSSESFANSDGSAGENENGQKSRLTITSTRVCKQELELPDDVYVVSADSAAADLSSSSMFTLSRVPYLFSTACSDGYIRFWSCSSNQQQNKRYWD